MTDGNEITNSDIYREILQSKNEVKSGLQAVEARLLMIIGELKQKLKSVEQENESLEARIESLERKSRKNNLILFGLKLEESDNVVNDTLSELKRLIDVDIDRSDVNNLYILNKSEKKPIIVEFVSFLKKLEVLGNCKKLRGSKVYISHDMTYRQREENKVLRKHLKLARIHKENKCYIRGPRLFVNGIAYSADELRNGEIEADINKEERPKSSPPTPDVNTIRGQRRAAVTELVQDATTRGVAEELLPSTPDQQLNKLTTATKQSFSGSANLSQREREQRESGKIIASASGKCQTNLRPRADRKK